ADLALVAQPTVLEHRDLRELSMHIHPDIAHHCCSPSLIDSSGEPLGRNDTYGYALAAQPDQSQGRPTTNTGSQPSVQERPAHTCSPKAPCSGRSHRMPNARRRTSRTTHVPPRHFIPGTNLIESMNARL